MKYIFPLLLMSTSALAGPCRQEGDLIHCDAPGGFYGSPAQVFPLTPEAGKPLIRIDDWNGFRCPIGRTPTIRLYEVRQRVDLTCEQ